MTKINKWPSKGPNSDSWWLLASDQLNAWKDRFHKYRSRKCVAVITQPKRKDKNHLFRYHYKQQEPSRPHLRKLKRNTMCWTCLLLKWRHACPSPSLYKGTILARQSILNLTDFSGRELKQTKLSCWDRKKCQVETVSCPKLAKYNAKRAVFPIIKADSILLPLQHSKYTRC